MSHPGAQYAIGVPQEDRLCRPGGVRRLLGRADECAVLDRLIQDIRRGESRSLLLRGEAGIGKSALLKYLVGSASDLTVVGAVGVESELGLAFASLHQVCAPMLDRLPRLPAPQREALEIAFGRSSGTPRVLFLIGLAVLSLFTEVAQERPLLCVVDDAQWLDRASALTFAFVARRLRAEPVGIVFAARHGDEKLQPVAELNIHGVRDRDARALLSSAVRLPLDERIRDRIVAETRGNPLALLELPRGLTATQLAGGFGLLGAHGLSGRIEESFVRQLQPLSDEARRLVLLAAAEPVGDPLLLWRAAAKFGIGPAAADEVEAHGLLAIGDRVRFRHPLARSAVYRSAAAEERRDVHHALAEATDRDADPDRRAWHLASAAAGPDEQVAAELERSAVRAQARGGLAAAAAFLQRAVTLTRDPAWRAGRALAAAQASLQAGAFDAALELLGTAELGPIDDFQHARIELLRAEVAFASNRGGAASALLVRAATRVEPLDARLARAGYLQALSAAMFEARLAAPGGGPRDVAAAVQAASPAAGPRTAADILLLDGWAALFADGCASATPKLREALTHFGDAMAAEDQLPLFWLVNVTAAVVWDAARWEVVSRAHVEFARSNGALSELPLALTSRSYIHLFRGELETADALTEEARLATDATGAADTQWGALALAVSRGEDDAAAMLDAAAADATRRGEGLALTVIGWARALLCNGLGIPGRALAAARDAIDCPTNIAATAWAMVEFIEAAARCGEHDAAAEVARRFAEIAEAAGTDWALGVDARSRALVSTGVTAEQLYREALDRLERCEMGVDLARGRLLYGEWLRRENRRADARTQLRTAHEQFTTMGMEGFAERARRELLATGEKVRKRIAETRDELSAQERQIARLARDGLSNPEIGARLFLSPRTVEWHLRKVFSKLDIHSRRQLSRALPSSESELVPT